MVSLAVLGGGVVACGSDGVDGSEGEGGNGNCVPGQPCEGGVPGEGGLVIPDDKCDDTGPDPTPVTGHPRLFLTQNDLPRLRSWATSSNPIWAEGLGTIATRSRQDMDAGKITGQDTGSAYSYTPYAVESYAMLFAFLSLIGPDEATRADDARRAKQLLMHVIDKAALGVGSGPYREEKFSTSNRSRWWGEGFGLTVDWIYGTLSAAEKAKIRSVFLRWAAENEDASITTMNHPEPKGVTNDPQLLTGDKVYWSGNNYYTAHMRNLTLMSLSFDEADDPGGELRKHLDSAMGAWLYTTDALLRSGLRGGLAGEGFEYGPQAHGYVAQVLLALHTAGLDAPKKNGKHTKLTCNPHWENSVNAFLHGIGPQGAVNPDPNYSYIGSLFPVAWYGDGAKSGWAPDYIGVFGPLGVYDQLTKNDARLSKLRWIEANTPPGGAAKMGPRISIREFMLDPIMYFLLFDPNAPEAPDPRPSTPLSHFDPGLGHMFARTSWGTDASWFTYQLGWSRIDHQHADGNLFQLWRKGEWLTKERSGYGLQIACSDYKNAVAIQNDPPEHNNPQDYGGIEYLRGSQWTYVNDGPGKIVAQVADPKYVYALGDATPLYRSTYENATDVTHASRSIVWLSPDRIFVYDRATTKKANRFKRFWMNFTANGTVSGRKVSVTSPKGQRLFVDSLLPAAATVTVEPVENLGGEPGELDPIRFRMKVEATGGPQNVRFLHVVKAADAGGSADATAVVTSTGGTPYEGASAGGVVVMFPVDIGGAFASLTYDAPGATAHLVTGLEPGAGYDVKQSGPTVTITPGGSQKADSGGVLVIGALP
ncbi:MAG: hypothetical protein JST00_07160 [Deltaproteobacteria bacterium]|nr:hypothetical protein [Deltaproteobacteria bacterium]